MIRFVTVGFEASNDSYFNVRQVAIVCTRSSLINQILSQYCIYSLAFLKLCSLMDVKDEHSVGFWNEAFWLPKGVTWKDLKDTEWKKYGQPSELAVAIPLTLLIFCVRLGIENLVMKSIGRKLGVSDARKQPPPANKLLDSVYRSVTKHPSPRQVEEYGKQLDWSTRKVQAWFRKKNTALRSSTLKKFSETGWRFVFYLSSFIYGIYVLYDEECVWNREKCWADFPSSHTMTAKLRWYYLIEIAFYTSTTATQFFDVKRKDFWEMFIHHVATIFLLTGSYIMNFTKMGSFIIIVHDSADFYLELAKMAKYADLKKTTNVTFALFAIAFFLSRMMVLPLWIIPSIWSGGVTMFAPGSVMHFLFPFLLLLQVLHCYWGYHVAGGVYASLVKGNIEKDSRSETEESTDTELEANADYKPARNGRKDISAGDTSNGSVAYRTRSGKK